jgi:inosose dehydratase
MPVPLANSPCSWGVDYANAPGNPAWPRVLDEIGDAGYRLTELGPVGYYPEDPGRLRVELDRRGLSVVAGFVFEPLHDPAATDRVMSSARRTLAMLQPLGARFLVVIDHITPERGAAAGRPDAAPRLDTATWQAMMARIRDVARMARDEYGILPVLHPHAACYIEYQDEIDRALSEIDESLLGLCIDTGHSVYAGIDPASLLRRYPGRTRYLHFKDLDPTVLATVIRERLDFDAAVARKVFTPLGKGCVDFAAFRDALAEAGYDGPGNIEQDIDPSGGSDPRSDAVASRRFLEDVGLSASSGPT